MKKDNNILYLGILFLASLLVELYAFLQFRDDTIVIIGTTVIVLVMAYLFWDSVYNKIISYKIQEKEENEARWTELEKLQKAIYMANRNSAKMAEENIELQKKQADTFLEAIKNIQLQASKFVAKHSREDIKNLIVSQQEEFKKLETIWQEEIKNLVSTEQEEIQKLLKSIEDIRDANLELAASFGKEEESSTNRGAAAYDVAAITDAISRNGESVRFKVEGGFELVEADLSEIRDQFTEFYKDWKTGKKEKDMIADTSTATWKEEVVSEELELKKVKDEVIPEEPELKEVADEVIPEEPESKEVEDEVISEEVELKKVEDEVVPEEVELKEVEDEVIPEEAELKKVKDEVILEEPKLKEIEDEVILEESELKEILGKPESKEFNIDMEEASQNESEDDVNMLSSEELEAIMSSLMSEEDISDEEKTKKEDSIGQEQVEEKQIDDILYQQEIDTLVSSVEEISNETIEKQKPVIPVDPNKPLSPEEVAALIASMGQ